MLFKVSSYTNFETWDKYNRFIYLCNELITFIDNGILEKQPEFAVRLFEEACSVAEAFYNSIKKSAFEHGIGIGCAIKWECSFTASIFEVENDAGEFDALELVFGTMGLLPEFREKVTKLLGAARAERQ